MAKKIFKGVGSVLGVNKKKAAPVEAAPVSGPVITQLKPDDPRLNKKRRPATLIGNTLGGTDRLGG